MKKRKTAAEKQAAKMLAYAGKYQHAAAKMLAQADRQWEQTCTCSHCCEKKHRKVLAGLFR